MDLLNIAALITSGYLLGFIAGLLIDTFNDEGINEQR